MRLGITREEFASLLTVGNCSMLDPPAVIPAQHSARLIGFGYLADIAGQAPDDYARQAADSCGI